MSSAELIREWIIKADLMSVDAAAEWIDRWRVEAAAGSGVDDLVAWLVAQDVLSEFHGEALRAGQPGPYLVGPYRVHEKIAAGRLGTIFRAVHVEFQQPVSLKIFPSELGQSPEKLARLGREARVAIEVDHPNVARTFHIGEEAGITYMAIEDLHGESLAARLARETRLPFAAACGIIRQAAIGLDYLHSQEIVHRDLQPANLWLATGGAVKIMEFGAARDALEFLDTLATGEQPTMTDVIVGTCDYMAPEQAQNAHTADARSDIYSLGCTLYHCLTGQVPFPDKSPIRQMLRHSNEKPKPVSDFAPDVPAALAETVAAMLAKRPQDRYHRAQDVAWAIEQFVEPADLAPTNETPSISGEFLQWARSAEGPAAKTSVAVSSPEGAEFMHWLESAYASDE